MLSFNNPAGQLSVQVGRPFDQRVKANVGEGALQPCRMLRMIGRAGAQGAQSVV